jgi:ElaB/YqjD/DUF883 family membrane-anchored ribosome-binding protein
MSSTTRAKTTSETPVDYKALIDDLAALSRDFSAMMSQLKAGAVDGVNDAAEGAIDRLSAQANAIYEKARVQSERSTRALGHQVEEHPIASLLIAFGAGFIASKLFVR